MSEQELIEWGRRELQLRMTELEAVKSPADLEQAQANAEQRRRAGKLTRNQAFNAIKAARRANRL